VILLELDHLKNIHVAYFFFKLSCVVKNNRVNIKNYLIDLNIELIEDGIVEFGLTDECLPMKYLLFKKENSSYKFISYYHKEIFEILYLQLPSIVSLFEIYIFNIFYFVNYFDSFC